MCNVAYYLDWNGFHCIETCHVHCVNDVNVSYARFSLVFPVQRSSMMFPVQQRAMMFLMPGSFLLSLQRRAIMFCMLVFLMPGSLLYFLFNGVS